MKLLFVETLNVMCEMVTVREVSGEVVLGEAGTPQLGDL
jgi:hypothetical protein